MKFYRFSPVTLALFITSLLLFSPLTLAVNSFSIAGPNLDGSSDIRKGAIDQVKNEFDDYYLGNYNTHIKNKYGMVVGEYMMAFQKNQPQHWIFFGHGIKNNNNKYGQIILLNTDDYQQVLREFNADDWAWWDGIKNGGKGTGYYPPGPLTMMIYQACGSGDQTPNPDHYNEAINRIGVWNLIMVQGYNANNGDGDRFLRAYSDSINDDSQCYFLAYFDGWNALSKDGRKRCGMTMWSRSGLNGMPHSAGLDVYRNIDSIHYDRLTFGDIINKGSSKTFYYPRAFQGTSNGAFVVFHGFLNSNEQDLQAVGQIIIEIKKWNGQWTPIADRWTTTWEVQNHASRGFYGGSDICSVYIKPGDLQTVNLEIKVKFNSNNQNTNNIQINRMEIMEIGSY